MGKYKNVTELGNRGLKRRVENEAKIKYSLISTKRFCSNIRNNATSKISQPSSASNQQITSSILSESTETDQFQNVQSEILNRGELEDDLISNQSESEEDLFSNQIEVEEELDVSPREFLANWSLEFNVTRDGVTALLKYFNKYFPDLPLDVRTLMKTPRKILVEDMEKGKFTYIGIKFNIDNILKRCVKLPKKIELDTNTDGVPIFKYCKDGKMMLFI